MPVNADDSRACHIVCHGRELSMTDADEIFLCIFILFFLKL